MVEAREGEAAVERKNSLLVLFINKNDALLQKNESFFDKMKERAPKEKYKI